MTIDSCKQIQSGYLPQVNCRDHPLRLPSRWTSGRWATACRHQPPTQGGGSAVGGRMTTVGEDYLPLHEMSTNSKRTTCSPLHMVCEVHHTKSGYEQLKSRNSPFRPTRSLSSPKRMRYDRFRSRCEAAGHLPARGDRRFCRAARSQMGSAHKGLRARGLGGSKDQVVPLSTHDRWRLSLGPAYCTVDHR